MSESLTTFLNERDSSEFDCAAAPVSINDIAYLKWASRYHKPVDSNPALWSLLLQGRSPDDVIAYVVPVFEWGFGFSISRPNLDEPAWYPVEGLPEYTLEPSIMAYYAVSETPATEEQLAYAQTYLDGRLHDTRQDFSHPWYPSMTNPADHIDRSYRCKRSGRILIDDYVDESVTVCHYLDDDHE